MANPAKQKVIRMSKLGRENLALACRLFGRDNASMLLGTIVDRAYLEEELYGEAPDGEKKPRENVAFYVADLTREQLSHLAEHWGMTEGSVLDLLLDRYVRE